MAQAGDSRVRDAHAKPIKDVADMLQIGNLRRSASEWVGPCPRPGCGGRDRFSLSTRKNLFNCRICGAKGDQIALVQHVLGLDFLAALDWLCGPRPELTPEQRAERERTEAQNAARRAAEAEKYRRRAIARAREIWQQGVAAEDTPVRHYLDRRGITRTLLPRLPVCLRFHPALPYMVERGPRDYAELHRGPAMLAAVQGPDGKFIGVHRTWIDLSQPKGKLVIAHPDTGEVLPSKKMEGTKKGGAIRLKPGARIPALVMAEGIETTFSAMVSGAMPDAAFWAGVDLGNMAGARMLGRGQKYAGIPDLTDAEAFVPPDWVRDLVFIQDGDSEPRLTRAKLLAGLRRAKATRPGLRARIVPVPEGMDLNDVLLRGVPKDFEERGME
ncbi:CHC2 zinc finger domain-containing protein [Defluviimonas sp. WL0002]|uniref:CHC2 zinc finger domain-containing protein n=1 Tax=Albidovulum marisflavi TaxID=2984159 RepID=A0ABT2ZHP3_9RHOB|nr:CHC2 zinc finger domain-containing protein [Defluviimonas sp. WL0002]MCV2870649.1 CHC2 zinc finger domain-containing protein [Defluviimonas sp. WL0002]